jgi:hypothetical protein
MSTKYNVIKEDGSILKNFDTYEAAERYFNYMNGIITVDYDKTGQPIEEHIYIQDNEITEGSGQNE